MVRMIRLSSFVPLIAGCIVLTGCESDHISGTSSGRGSLDQQAQCASQADKVAMQREKDSGYAATEKLNHFNPNSKVCAVSIDTLIPGGSGNLTHQIVVMDAFERRQLGFFSRGAGKPDCYVTTPSGEDKKCDTEDDFAKLIKVYMK